MLADRELLLLISAAFFVLNRAAFQYMFYCFIKLYIKASEEEERKTNGVYVTFQPDLCLHGKC